MQEEGSEGWDLGATRYTLVFIHVFIGKKNCETNNTHLINPIKESTEQSGSQDPSPVY